MKTIPPFLVLFLALVATACAPKLQPIYESQKAVANYIDNGDYLRDFSSVVAEARNHLSREAAGTANNLAIVLDIDETALSNWPAYRKNGFARIVEGPCDLEKGPCGIRAWQASGKSEALDPMVDFVRYARGLGVKVFFISGRPSDLQGATEENLKRVGYAFEQVVVYPPRAPIYKSAVDFKTPERQKIVDRGLRIVLCMGDQESDIVGGSCERGFKLPNPVYYLP